MNEMPHTPHQARDTSHGISAHHEDSENPASEFLGPYDRMDDDTPAVKPKHTSNYRRIILDNGEELTAIQPAVELPLDFTEFGLADAFSDSELGSNSRFTAQFGIWHIWDGERWRRDDKRSIKNMARQHILNALKTQDGWRLSDRERKVLKTFAQINSILNICACDPRHAVTHDEWDKDAFMLGVPSGCIDLRTGDMLPPDRAMNMTKQAACTPAECRQPGDDTDPHPLWTAAIKRYTRGDAELQQYLQRWAGYMLTGDTRESAFILCYGPGASGKTTLITTISEILGDYAINAPMEMFMHSNQPGHPTEIARLHGARLVTATETADGSRWNESRIKTMTGGEKLTGRFMNQDFFEYKGQFKLMFGSNHKPVMRSVGEEMRRRVHLVDFPDIIPEAERDNKLPEKLRAEYPEILRWMINGCIEWQRTGLCRPEKVLTATTEYLHGEDFMAAWMDECVERRDGCSELAGAVYASFKEWADGAGEYVPPQKRFLQRLEEKGFARTKINGVAAMSGLRLRVSGQGDYGY